MYGTVRRGTLFINVKLVEVEDAGNEPDKPRWRQKKHVRDFVFLELYTFFEEGGSFSCSLRVLKRDPKTNTWNS